MYPSAFRYHKAATFGEACDMLVKLGPDARPMAGGQTLIPMMKLRLVSPSDLVDLGGIEGAQEIQESGDTVEIGALARHQDIGKSALAAHYPILKDCALGIADVQVRNMGTIGGSLAEADPNSCWPALLVALDAKVICVSKDGTREQAVRDLLADAYTPNLEPGELITKILIDRKALSGEGTFVAFKRAAPAYPTASCALTIQYDGETVCSARFGFGCLALTPLAMDATAALAGKTVTSKLIQDIAETAAAFVEPITDNKGTEAYKRSLLKGLVKRAFDVVERRRRGEAVTETHFYYG
ncbi:MAG: xanthine dehydrogenase family protein subunit M [Pseudorhodoplanes sp.]